MTLENVRKLIEKEFDEKTLGVTEQYLDIHQAIYEDGILKIDRVDEEGGDDVIIAYLPIKDEYFSFAVYIDQNKNEIFNIGTESRNIVCLRVESVTLSAKSLQSFTNLTPTRFWNKGDLKPNSKSAYSFSFLEFTPNSEPDEFEDKLKKLLSYLSSDKKGVLELTKNAHTYIQVIMDFHGGNQLLGAATVDLESITKLNELNLSISFDIAVWGNSFR